MQILLKTYRDATHGNFTIEFRTPDPFGHSKATENQEDIQVALDEAREKIKRIFDREANAKYLVTV